jgi:Spy/CpxP family protein refolding chaperone
MTATVSKVARAIALAAGLMMAQGPRFGSSTAGWPADPQQALQWRLDRMAVILDLTATQKTQATAISSAALNANQALGAQLTQAATALHDAAKANQPAANIDKLAATLGVLIGQMQATGAKAFAQFYAILTPAQQQQLDKHAGAGFGFGGFGAGPYGPGRGGFSRHSSKEHRGAY